MNEVTPGHNDESKDRKTMKRRSFLAAGAAVGMGAAVAKVGGPGTIRFPASSGAVDLERELQKPAQITFWTWVSKIQKQVAIFEKKGKLKRSLQRQQDRSSLRLSANCGSVEASC